MAKCLVFVSMVVLAGMPALAGGKLPSSRTIGCEDVADEMSLPDRLRESRRGSPVWQQVDDVLIRLLPALQGQQCSYRFSQLFKGVDNGEFIPLTNRLLSALPEASLAGLTAYDRNGAELGRVTRRGSAESDDSLPSYLAFVWLGYETADGKQASTARQLLDGDVLLKWDDVKDRVAVSTLE